MTKKSHLSTFFVSKTNIRTKLYIKEYVLNFNGVSYIN